MIRAAAHNLSPLPGFDGEYSFSVSQRTGVKAQCGSKQDQRPPSEIPDRLRLPQIAMQLKLVQNCGGKQFSAAN